MNKPKPITYELIDYHEASLWINKKLGYDIRDCLGKFKKGGDRTAEYRDFWHFLVDALAHPPSGTISIIYEDLKEDAEDWQIEILETFWEEFGSDAQYLF